MFLIGETSLGNVSKYAEERETHRVTNYLSSIIFEADSGQIFIKPWLSHLRRIVLHALTPAYVTGRYDVITTIAQGNRKVKPYSLNLANTISMTCSRCMAVGYGLILTNYANEVQILSLTCHDLLDVGKANISPTGESSMAIRAVRPTYFSSHFVAFSDASMTAEADVLGGED